MDHASNPLSTEAIAAAFDWWREAGVEGDLGDEPVNWLALSGSRTPAEPSAAAAVPAVPPLQDQDAGGDVAPFTLQSLPGEIGAFRQWWMSAPELDSGPASSRVPPRGQPGAGLMIVVPQPEAGDSDRLLSGPQGRLLDAMLDAMGHDADAIYLASVLPCRTPHADWGAIASRGLGIALAHHVGLAVPGRLIVFGGNILPLLGNILPNSADTSLRFNHDGTDIPLLAARSLESLLERKAWKAGFWKDWLGWAG